MKSFEIKENFSSKALLKMAGRGVHPPLDPPLVAQLVDVLASTAHRQMESY